MSVRIPAEWERHSCCWMAWAVHSEWHEWKRAVEDELCEVIRTVAQYEPVSLLVPRKELAEACARFSGEDIEIIEAPVDDIWMRDIAPTFRLSGNDVVALDWNFNGWGNTIDRPTRPGDYLAKAAESVFGVTRISPLFVAEGGALVTDGQGMLVTTRSCLLNPNRNNMNSVESCESLVERELAKLGISRVIWLEGDPSEPISSGHVDGYVMFTGVGKILFEAMDDEDPRPQLARKSDFAILKQARNVSGNRMRIEKVYPPREKYCKSWAPYWAPCYLNAYVANGGVITACFGDPERDEAARRAIATAFPGRDVVMLRIDNITRGGGGVHCLTQPMPALKEVIGSQ